MIDRRAFALGAMLAPAASIAAFRLGIDPVAIERGRVLRLAGAAVSSEVRTITAVSALRSRGGPNDYYSEADYWWPDPAGQTRPFVRRDGFTYPGRFDEHRRLLIRFGRDVPALAAAWLLTRERSFAAAVERHLHAWFVASATRMNPDLQYAQAIIGRDEGRAIGIIDTLQIVEVARAVARLRRDGAPVSAAAMEGARSWFATYLEWLVSSGRGRQERDQRNNHGTCWLLQAAAFADAAGDASIRPDLRRRLADVIVPTQVDVGGGQPLELARTKPYGYSLFNMDVLATCALLLSDGNDLWIASRPGRGSIADAVAHMIPFIADRRRWPLPPDVEHFDAWPVRHPALLFYGDALGRPDATALWARLDPDPTASEVVRNHPIRQPVLWT